MKFRIYIFIISFLLSCLHLISQDDKGMLILNHKEYDQYFGFNTSMDIGSSAVINSFLFKFGFGGFIDNSLKSNVISRLDDVNIFGKMMDYSFYYRQENNKLLGFKGVGFQAAFVIHNQLETTFSSDLFHLIFEGNKSYTGRTADFSGTALRSLNYYQFKGGFNRLSANKMHYWQFNLALNLGNNFNLMQVENGGFFTSTMGDSINFSSDFSYKYLGKNTNTPFDIYGFGTGLDFYYRFLNEGKYRIIAQVEQFGFIHWGKKYRELVNPQSLNWKGLEVDNILAMTDQLFIINLNDSLDNFLKNNSITGSYSIFTPAVFSISFGKYFLSEKYELMLTVKKRFWSNYKTLILLQGNININDKMVLSPSISYGGYSKFNIGFGMQYQWKDGLKLNIGTQYLTGLVLINTFSGIGGFIQLSQQI